MRYQLNITEITKKNYKKRLEKNIEVFPKKKKKKQQYGCEQYTNLSNDENQRLAEYRKKYYKTRKNASL